MQIVYGFGGSKDPLPTYVGDHTGPICWCQDLVIAKTIANAILADCLGNQYAGQSARREDRE